MKLSTLIVSALLALPLAALVPVATADVDSCAANTVIFSRNSNAPASINSNALICIVKNTAGVSEPDTAFINPGSNRVQVRHTVDLGEDHLLAHVEGLGLVADVVLARTQHVTGAWLYDSPSLTIDPTARGSITASVSFPDGEFIESVTFRTVA